MVSLINDNINVDSQRSMGVMSLGRKGGRWRLFQLLIRKVQFELCFLEHQVKFNLVTEADYGFFVLFKQLLKKLGIKFFCHDENS